MRVLFRLLFCAAIAMPLQIHASPRQVRIDNCVEASDWSVNLGWEFPGAIGTVAAAVAPTGSRCVELRYNFTGGGNYVAAQRPLTVAQATAVSFSVRQDGSNYGFVRIRDESGQEHAGGFGMNGSGWQRVTLNLTSEVFGGHWGGKNDGIFHYPLDTILIGVSKGPTKVGILDIKDLSMTTDDPNSFFGIRVKSVAPGNVLFTSNKPVGVTCEIGNRLEVAADVGIHFRVVDWHGRRIAVPAVKLHLAPYAFSTVPIRLPGNRTEYYRIETTLTGPDVRQMVSVDGAIVVRRPRNFGVDDPNSFFALQQTTDGARTERLGVKWVRAGMDWRWGEMIRGQYAPVSVKDIRRNHQMVMYTMSAYAPDWAEKAAGSQDFWVGDGSDERAGWWANYVEHRARELGKDVYAFEIQNEPDLTCMWQAGIPFAAGVERYVRILRVGAAAVRRGAPGARIAGIDVSGGDYDQNLPFSRAVLAKSGDLIDVYTGHPYAAVRYFGKGQEPMWPGRNGERRKCLETLDMLKNAHGTQRFWVGEKGWGLNVSTDPLSDYSRDFARCLVQSMVTAHSVPGVERYYWFLEEGCNEDGNEYGLFRAGKPLPAALAYSVMANTLHAATPRRSFTLGGVLQAHSFGSTDTRLGTTVVWSEKGEALLVLKSMPPGARIIDIAGAETASPKASREWRIPIDCSPIYLQYPLKSASRAENSIALARIQVAKPFLIEAVYAEDVSTLGLRVRNLTDQLLQFSTMSSGVGINAVAKPLAVAVATLRLPKPLAQGPNGVKVVVMALGVREQAIARTDFTPCPRAIPPADNAIGLWLQTGIPVVLDKREQILPSDPGIGWDGPEDLSARIWTTWDDTALRLFAIVRDDVHVVRSEQAESFWNSDSLQIGVDPLNSAGSSPGYNADDVELGVVIGPNGPVVLQTWPKTRRVDLRADGKREGHDTTYRLDIPWKLLGVKARPGLVVGFNVIVNDNDGNGRAYWTGMTPGIGESKRPAVFKKLLLER